MNDLADKLKVYLLCRYALGSSIYTSWTADLDYEVEVVEQCPTDWNPPSDCGIVVTHEHYRWEELSTLRKIYEQRSVPILILADGILEYRNTWQNPTIPDQSLYQPLIGNKIACIGKSSARMIESWGNVGKTEVVGLPRLDALLNSVGNEGEPSAGNDDEFRLLIATATTPAFDDQQRTTVIRSLQELQSQLANNKLVADRKVVPTWRLTDGLAAELGMEENSSEQDESDSLHDAIRNSDAVITTPSTIFLESALIGKPTAVLDFHHVPQYLSSAWTISSSDQIAMTINELANPPKPKIEFQQFVLSEHLECHSPAAPRMRELVEAMILAGQNRSSNEPLSLPANLLRSDTLPADTIGNGRADATFEAQELDRLRSELNQAVHRLETIPRELADKNNQISQLQTSLDESRRRVADVRTRLFKLRKILGIGKENQGEDVDG